MKRTLTILLSFLLLFSILPFASAEDLKGPAAISYYTDQLDNEEIDGYEAIGTLYREGLNGISRDYQLAIEWYQKGIDAGKVPSITAMGYMYFRGFGIVRDYDKAYDLFQQAADLGDGYAMYLIGNMYELGIKVEKDDEEALSWYQKSADAGYEFARVKIAEYTIYIDGDTEKGLALYQEAADGGILEAYLFLGDYYWEAESMAAAKPYYTKGAELGEKVCMGKLGNMYVTGKGSEKSYTQAIEWLTKGSEAGDPASMASLADQYFVGYFGNSKPERAKILYTEAAARGDAYALRAVAYRMHAKPTTGYDQSKDETTRALELYGKALARFRDEENERLNGWHYQTFSIWDTESFMEYIDGMVDNHVCTREYSDQIINAQIENFRLD